MTTSKTGKVVVNDTMQVGYVYYRTEPAGRNFFAGFAPELTPAQICVLASSAAST